MKGGVQLFPDQASTFASRVDAITFYMTALCGSVAILVAGLILYFIVRYHHTAQAERTLSTRTRHAIEYAWTAIPFLLFLGIFIWGARVYFEMHVAPPHSTEIYVVAKQWMWKFQHPSGLRELDELHVPVGQPIKLVMASQDVIHSFFVPEFRIKQDVVPGRYTYTWFEATEPGTYHLFCAEYCGNSHAEMRGRIVAMKPEDYERWATTQTTGSVTSLSAENMASRGRELFTRLGCVSCHGDPSKGLAPDLHGLYMRQVGLRTGETVVADDNYLRESILNPGAKIAMGYQPIMPSFQGQISEEDLLDLIAFIRSMQYGQKPEAK